MEVGLIYPSETAAINQAMAEGIVRSVATSGALRWRVENSDSRVPVKSLPTLRPCGWCKRP